MAAGRQMPTARKLMVIYVHVKAAPAQCVNTGELRGLDQE